jgi:hypothetical protein
MKKVKLIKFAGIGFCKYALAAMLMVILGLSPTYGMKKAKEEGKEDGKENKIAEKKRKPELELINENAKKREQITENENTLEAKVFDDLNIGGNETKSSIFVSQESFNQQNELIEQLIKEFKEFKKLYILHLKAKEMPYNFMTDEGCVEQPNTKNFLKAVKESANNLATLEKSDMASKGSESEKTLENKIVSKSTQVEKYGDPKIHFCDFLIIFHPYHTKDKKVVYTNDQVKEAFNRLKYQELRKLIGYKPAKDVTDEEVIERIKEQPSLEIIDLSFCDHLKPQTLKCLLQTCKNLISLDMNYWQKIESTLFDLFASTKLKKLNLKFINMALVKGAVSFPHLKFLNLSHACCGEQSNKGSIVLDNCPELEELDVSYSSYLRIDLNCPKLKKLNLKAALFQAITLNCSTLKELNLTGGAYPFISNIQLTCPSLEILDINNASIDYNLTANNLICPNLRILSFSKVECNGMVTYPVAIIIDALLKHSSSLVKIDLWGPQSSADINTVINLLQNSPKLETLFYWSHEHYVTKELCANLTKAILRYGKSLKEIVFNRKAWQDDFSQELIDLMRKEKPKTKIRLMGEDFKPNDFNFSK